MLVPVSPTSHRQRFSLPDEPGRRIATWSLLMAAVSAVAVVVAGALGTFFQTVVFDLQDQELLSEAGLWGYVVGFFLTALIALPGLVGVVLGVRAWRLGAHRMGATVILVNAVIAALLVSSSAVSLVFG